jgi:hypothetical protein
VSTLTKFAPTVAAIAFFVYVVASGQTAQIPAALAGVLGAFGLHSAQSAHAKIEKL